MGTKKGSRPTNEKPIALTVKVDHGTYVRLCTFVANQRKKKQDILKQALKEYLDREGA
jgi:predicted transcriptional regulator